MSSAAAATRRPSAAEKRWYSSGAGNGGLADGNGRCRRSGWKIFCPDCWFPAARPPPDIKSEQSRPKISPATPRSSDRAPKTRSKVRSRAKSGAQTLDSDRNRRGIRGGAPIGARDLEGPAPPRGDRRRRLGFRSRIWGFWGRRRRKRRERRRGVGRLKKRREQKTREGREIIVRTSDRYGGKGRASVILEINK